MPGVLGLLAATLSISLIWPQVWLCCRRRRTGGLSPTASFLSVALNVSWFTFGVLSGDRAQWITNSVVGLGNIAVLTALLITRPSLRAPRMLARTAAGAAGLVTFAVGGVVSMTVLGTAPATVAAALGAVSSVVGAGSSCVQPASLLRDRSQDLSGLSRIRYWLSAGACSSWTAYGWLEGRPAVWGSAVVGLCCAVVVVSLLRSRRAPAAVATRIGSSGERLAVLRPAVRSRVLAVAA